MADVGTVRREVESFPELFADPEFVGDADAVVDIVVQSRVELLDAPESTRRSPEPKTYM